MKTLPPPALPFPPPFLTSPAPPVPDLTRNSRIPRRQIPDTREFCLMAGKRRLADTAASSSSSWCSLPPPPLPPLLRLLLLQFSPLSPGLQAFQGETFQKMSTIPSVTCWQYCHDRREEGRAHIPEPKVNPYKPRPPVLWLLPRSYCQHLDQNKASKPSFRYMHR